MAKEVKFMCNPKSENRLVFNKEFTRQEPIPEDGIKRAMEIMETGRLHRYNTVRGEVAETSLLEKEFADYVGTAYCTGLSSCGSAIYVALKSVGVLPGDRILCNAFTLAPVPGAIMNTEAEPIFVEIDENYLTDLDDLEEKAEASGAKFFLLSHMRGHIVDMDRVTEICNRFGITMIEDCAHTMGAKWGDKFTGTFGEVGCFSTQTYKHINSGEGGLLVTNDDNVAAKVILYSGSYMLYEKHIAKPPLEVFEKYKQMIPNFSLRMSNLVAALIRSQLPELDKQCTRWNDRYKLIEKRLRGTPYIRLPERSVKEHFVGSSFQFTIKGAPVSKVKQFINTCSDRGIEIKWFGSMEPKGFTSRFESWEYFGKTNPLPKTAELLNFMCDFRVPLTFSLDDCKQITTIIQQVTEEVMP
ncbi:DegT/DnrJ/EryC1/StrS family aminotransferase [Halobacillus sp. A1]|uniref:DegT/DnrJ/EryC1/StrS family aminotransferase n=1 Tax=Halobacillus sp. A1 TaxID=2880262 RepID=UPI0020A6A3BE|nr:DegT/DnrJ/EryC1/StrS family aminotransferase [Halobacillus sp. A1]MCP3032358.1 DegT/DnrJ/EryC1/StrS family aminotransferase [Halobacillus sp. A1]